MLRYAISDRRLFPGNDADRLGAVVEQAARLSCEDVDYFQIREKDLPAAELLALTVAVRDAARTGGAHTRVLLNGAPDLAASAGVGVHLPFHTWSAMRLAGDAAHLHVASISCHSPEEVEAASASAEAILFAPVFEKQVAGRQVSTGRGLDALFAASSRSGGTPVFALGGVTQANAQQCLAAGASGVAGIRLFLELPQEE